MLVNNQTIFQRLPFASESELESVVWEHANWFFGADSLVLPKMKIQTGSGAGTIPDGFAIDFQTQTWYIVEAEIASHGVWAHIAPQISKQLTAIDQESSREKLLELAIKEIKTMATGETFLDDLNLTPIDVPGVIRSILKKPPVVAIPIDEIPPDLSAWVNTIRYSVKIWLVEKFVNSKTGEVLYSIPDEQIPSIATTISNGKLSETVVTRFNQPYREVMAAGYWKEGDSAWMEYGPRLKPKRTFTGILRKEGIEVDGKIMSLSAAAVYCMKQAGSNRPTANGWIMWRNEKGILLSDFFQEYYSKAVIE